MTSAPFGGKRAKSAKGCLNNGIVTGAMPVCIIVLYLLWVSNVVSEATRQKMQQGERRGFRGEVRHSSKLAKNSHRTPVLGGRCSWKRYWQGPGTTRHSRKLSACGFRALEELLKKGEVEQVSGKIGWCIEIPFCVWPYL